MNEASCEAILKIRRIKKIHPLLTRVYVKSFCGQSVAEGMKLARKIKGRAGVLNWLSSLGYIEDLRVMHKSAWF